MSDAAVPAVGAVVDHRVMLFASDVAASRAFYEQRLGFAVEPLGGETYVLRRDGLELLLEGGARARKRGRRWVEEAGVLISLRVRPFDAFVDDLRARGVALLGDVIADDDGRRVTGFADPDGNLFEIQEVE